MSKEPNEIMDEIYTAWVEKNQPPIENPDIGHPEEDAFEYNTEAINDVEVEALLEEVRVAGQQPDFLNDILDEGATLQDLLGVPDQPQRVWTDEPKKSKLGTDRWAEDYWAKRNRGEEAKSEGSVEFTGGSVNYYQVEVLDPTTPGRAPYVAECNDIIEALGMNFAEGNAFKAIWRVAAARNLNKHKAGGDPFYDAEKVVFFGERMKAMARKRG